MSNRRRIVLALASWTALAWQSHAVQLVSSNASEGKGSLRQAVSDANPGELINFDVSLSGAVIELGGSQITISKPVEIDASDLPGGITIDGQRQSRVFEIEAMADPSATVTMRGLTIIGGRSPDGSNVRFIPSTERRGGDGGGILNAGRLHIFDSVIRESVAGDGGADIKTGISPGSGGNGGGISNSGTLRLEGSKICDCISGNANKGVGDDSRNGGNGGGLHSTGSVTILDSTISKNSTGEGDAPHHVIHEFDAGDGGGFANFGTAEIINSTFSENTTGDGLFGILKGFGGHGGAIANFGTLTISNSTIFSNETGHGEGRAGRGGGIDNLSGDLLEIVNSTIVGNSVGSSGEGFGGGIFGGAGLILTNSIIAGNISSSGVEIHSSSKFATTGVNIFADLEGSGLTAGETVVVASPQLAPLGDYGGPTLTMPPLPGSTCIDPASGQTESEFDSDQRGKARIVGHTLDVGAVEYQGKDEVTRLLFLIDADGDGSPLGIEQALGTDWQTSDRANSRNLTMPIFDVSGQATVRFGIGMGADSATIWILSRSTDLRNFSEIFRFDGTTNSPGAGIQFTNDGSSISVTDTNPPPMPGVFYRFEVDLAE